MPKPYISASACRISAGSVVCEGIPEISPFEKACCPNIPQEVLSVIVLPVILTLFVAVSVRLIPFTQPDIVLLLTIASAPLTLIPSLHSDMAFSIIVVPVLPFVKKYIPQVLSLLELPIVLLLTRPDILS
jgi:hypothetical protein